MNGNPSGSIRSSGARNLREFGAKGNGLADDTAALLRAAEHLNEYGGDLLIPAGVFVFEDGVTLSGPLIYGGDESGMSYRGNFTIKGEAAGASELRFLGSGAAITVSNPFAQAQTDPLQSWAENFMHNVRFQDLLLRGPSSPSSWDGTSIGIDQRDTSQDWIFEGLTFTGWGGHALRTFDVTNASLRQVRFYKNRRGLAAGHKFDGASLINTLSEWNDIAFDLGYVDPERWAASAWYRANFVAGLAINFISGGAGYNRVAVSTGSGLSGFFKGFGFEGNSQSDVEIGHNPTDWPAAEEDDAARASLGWHFQGCYFNGPGASERMFRIYMQTNLWVHEDNIINNSNAPLVECMNATADASTFDIGAHAVGMLKFSNADTLHESPLRHVPDNRKMKFRGCKVAKVAAAQSIPNYNVATDVVVTFDEKSDAYGCEDPMGWWDTTNNRFKPTESGRYRFHLCPYLTGGEWASGGYFQFAKNTIPLGQTINFTSADAGRQPVGHDFVIYLDGINDYVQVVVTNGNPFNSYNISNFVGSGSAPSTWLQITPEDQP